MPENKVNMSEVNKLLNEVALIELYKEDDFIMATALDAKAEPSATAKAETAEEALTALAMKVRYPGDQD